jgi:lipoprotein-releasing system ATP-binding protein
MSSEFIQVQQLVKIYGNGAKRVEVLKGLDLAIPKAERMAIGRFSRATNPLTSSSLIGPPPVRTYAGRDVFMEKHLLAFSESRAVSSSTPYLLPEFSALRTPFLCPFRMTKKEATSRAESILTLVGLKERLIHKPGELSGGEQQRVAVARAMVLEPKVLLADEPTGNLDTKTGESVFDLLLELNRTKGITLVIVTHNLKLAQKMSRQIQLLEGKAVE